jgi:phosphoribosylformylglycinamidine synthase subunit PurS
MRVRVFVSLKEGVHDPQGKAVQHSLETLGYNEVRDVRVGKVITLEVEGDDRAAAEPRVKEMCEKLLANTVIESYRFEFE